MEEMPKEWTASAAKDLRDAGFTEHREGEKMLGDPHLSRSSE